MSLPQDATPGSQSLDGGTVRSHVADGVGTVEFFHPKGNSLPGSLLRALADAITGMGADPNARVIYLRSGGTGAFCAGASFDELTAVSDVEAGTEFFSGFSRVVLAMIRAPKFVVTRVHGRAAGGAVGIIAASDLSLGVSTVAAKLSELAIGIGPFVIGPVVERKVGLSAYSAMSVDADWRDAAWCERHGLLSRILETPEAMDQALDKELRKLASFNPEAMAELKRVFWVGTESWDQLLAERAAMSGRMVLSDFTRQAIASFKAR